MAQRKSGRRTAATAAKEKEKDPAKEKDPVTGRLSCGCELGFRAGVEGSPVTVMLARKGAGCGLSIHVAGLPVYDHREALRPPTRLAPPPQSDYEES